MNRTGLNKALSKAAKDAGGVRAFARLHGISPPYVSDVLAGKRAPGPKILKALGLTKTVTVEFKEVKK